ncbi:GGDEF domain-containing protein [Petroclostridium sp. X23]|uniref:sensor domain-containing diguanylate cyclase n=1 Tax=Petroclostridium sp. X23 TaxID=3045146 RepID=UPI0024AD0640|nr:GGDEF domain-containing protein [Petroclostridium sp. X23]WHH59563.1 GGDEF domain-containing protein [Petroclostridium sp. X23]
MGKDCTFTKSVNVLLMVAMLTALYLSSLYNYLLFHSIAEIFSICIAFTIFMLTWNSEKYIKSNYLLLIGVAYLFIGFLDLLHTLSYKGMKIFTDYDYYANQLWIATRYMESVTLLTAFIFIRVKKHISVYTTFFIYVFITAIIVFSIFIWRIFPICFIDGVGLTSFKKISEYIISGFLVLSIFFLYKGKANFDHKVYQYLLWSIIFTIGSELAFTFYINNYGVSNLVGHYLKIFSFYLIYKAVIEKGIREPYEIIFRELKENEQKLCAQNDQYRNQAIMDGLTGLYNHRYLYEKLEEEMECCNIYESDLSIVLFDIDFFKKVNDSYGHVVGDEILRSIAKIIEKNIRSSDIAGRYGGEEFLVILPKTNLEGAYLVAEKIRLAIESNIFINGIKVTISGGVCEYSGEKASGLVQSADEKMYKAKHSGRNLIVM